LDGLERRCAPERSGVERLSSLVDAIDISFDFGSDMPDGLDPDAFGQMKALGKGPDCGP
jgi:hypothetical protein